MSYKTEQVVSASYVTRPKEGFMHIADHHGVVVKTNQGNNYLIHSVPSSGVVVTDAKYMTGNWRVDHPINVRGAKTVHGAHPSASGRSLNPMVNYVTSGSCIMSAKNAENYLLN
ncbi:hypothetical protein DFA_02833 [Cavenderia fasciculata]|uniref:Uncharacterized protein n=1 Tax=Cavenderia fasciculata TaxID=261658 RepID=F4PIL0_CACFS|nr:uncharacterized protein DFA_02833 [Cavenderia fasciculata]EGG24590.1 hypothetical protein DFA_02833 [Cavenderia fasciculata]|eukprot:XP_004362441.1 hypothetical protein DFA_02833 [Cavenderia fasciculata]